MRSLFNIPERMLLLLLVSAMLAAPASGGVYEGNGEIGFDIGWVDLDGRDYSDYGDEGRVSFRGGYHFTDLFQLEGQVLGLGSGGPYGGEAVGGLFVNAVFNFHPSETIVPYVLVGLGTVETTSFAYGGCYGGPGRPGRPGRPGHPCHDGHYRYDDDYEASAAVQVAVGSRFFFGRGRTAFRLEGSLLSFEDDFDRDRELLSLSVGLTWRLGKSRRPAPAVAAGTD